MSGVAVVFGFPGGVAIAGLATFNQFNQSGDFSSSNQRDYVIDDDGEKRSVMNSGRLITATLTFTPRAATGTNTKANAREALPAPEEGSAVTLTGFQAPAGAADWINKADWSLVSWKAGFRNNGVASYEITIERNPNYDISAAVS